MAQIKIGKQELKDGKIIPAQQIVDGKAPEKKEKKKEASKKKKK